MLRISCFLNPALVDLPVLLALDDQSQLARLLVACLDLPRLLFLSLVIIRLRVSNHLILNDLLIIHFFCFHHVLLCLLLSPIFLYFLILLLTFFHLFLVLLPSFLLLLLFQLNSIPQNLNFIFLILLYFQKLLFLFT